MAEAVWRIRLLKPQEILVSTGDTPFFLPARRMYLSAGFVRQAFPLPGDRPGLVAYRIPLCENVPGQTHPA